MLRQNKLAGCQRPRYTGREEGRDLIGYPLGPHDALTGVNQQSHSGGHGGQVFSLPIRPLVLYRLPHQTQFPAISKV